MRDNRIVLENGYEINKTDGKKIKINSEVGRGASCIVYDAEYKDFIGQIHNIRIKEYYPSYLFIERKKNGELVPLDTNSDSFNEEKKRFIQAYQKNVVIGKTLGLINSTINSTDIFSYNNSCYIIMTLSEGSDYSKYQDQSLTELFLHIKSLAELIKKYHDKGYLHLDIKPENVFILPETEEHILLFDFDSVMTKEELTSIGRFRLSFSEGFSAPEQIQGKINKIGVHTDIFSIGALMFYKLFDRKVTLDECRICGSFKFDEMSFFNKKYQPKFYKTLEKFLKKTLSVSVILRWNNMRQLIDCLNELITLSDLDGEYLMDTFQYNTGCFIGRESEMDEIHNILSGNQLIFVSGIGGIGKTELVKQYANRYRNLYDTVVFSIFAKDIESLVNDEIIINHVEKDEAESASDYFKRKIDILKDIVTDKDLIIIDNFDVDSDDNLETLFCCPCKFIITSRMDFRDYNYKQISIERMQNVEDVFQLFYTYNDEEYDTEDAAAVENLLDYVDYHTMTVELIAKYLRVSGETPATLFNRFMEKEGIINTEDISVKQRKDHRLRAESVNNHLMILFDVSGFEDTEKELIGSLSFYAGIRMKRRIFEDICLIDHSSEKLDKLIKRGWIEYNEKTDKISLHQIIQDLIYKNLSPNAENCPNIVIGMIQYMNTDTANYSEAIIKQRVFDVFMGRITGSGIPYAKLCLLYAKKDQLDKAEQICMSQEDKEVNDILQRIYRKKIKIISDCYDLGESEELEFDEYVTSRLKLIEGLLDKAMACYRKYRDDADYTIKEYMDISGEIVKDVFGGNIGIYSIEPTPDMGRIIDKIIDKVIYLYNTVTELLPNSSFTAGEKETYYKRIRDFYFEEEFNIMILGKSDYISDVEKAYWYQERIDEVRKEMRGESANVIVRDAGKTIYRYSDDIPCSALAEKYEEEGAYQKALVYYKKAYEDGDERYESVMQSMAQVYLKMNEPQKAIECLEKVLDCDKENEKDSDAYFSYTCYICIDLIKNLIKLQDYEKAKAYALELIHYEEPETLKEDNSYAVTNVLTAYYYLYDMEKELKKKKLFWQQCIKYYKMLENNRIEDDIFDFIVEYLRKEDICWDEIFEILDRIDNWNTKHIKEKIILNIIAKNEKMDGFGRYHVILMLKYASLYNEYPYEFIKEAESKCEKAQELYRKYGLDDKYVQSLMYHTMAEIISNDNDYSYDQKLEIKKKCDYSVLAEQELEKAVDDEKRIEIWKNAADSYKYIDNNKMQVYCLEKSLEIIIPILNLYEFSKFNENYWSIMCDMIQAYIQLEDFEKAKYDIDELYKHAIEFFMSVDSADAGDVVWQMKSIADYYSQSSLREKAVNTYLAALYMALEKDSNKYDILRADDLKIETNRLSQVVDKLLDETIDNDLIDSIIELKDELVSYRDEYQGDRNIYDEIISKINERYQNRDIEFKASTTNNK